MCITPFPVSHRRSSLHLRRPASEWFGATHVVQPPLQKRSFNLVSWLHRRSICLLWYFVVRINHQQQQQQLGTSTNWRAACVYVHNMSIQRAHKIQKFSAVHVPCLPIDYVSCHCWSCVDAPLSLSLLYLLNNGSTAVFCFGGCLRHVIHHRNVHGNNDRPPSFSRGNRN